MITIPANTAFKPFAPVFTLQTVEAAAVATLKISVDGATYTDYPGGTAETFTGSQVFSDYPTGAILKCDVAVYCSDDSTQLVPVNRTVTITAPSHGQIKAIDLKTKQPVASSAPTGTQIELTWFDKTTDWRFVKWTVTTASQNDAVEYFDERPIITLTGNITIAVTIEQVPTPTHLVWFSCEHGTASATVSGSAIVSGTRLPDGSTVIFTITPDEGYEYNGTTQPTTLPGIVVHSTINKVFRCIEIQDRVITFSCIDGSVAATVGGVGIQSGSSVPHGSTVIFTITPDTGYKYAGTDQPTSESVIADTNITKNYVCERLAFYEVTYHCINGSVDARVGGQQFPSGVLVREFATVVFTITPDEGYEYTGTNPETVVVTSEIDRRYECTAINVEVDLPE